MTPVHIIPTCVYLPGIIKQTIQIYQTFTRSTLAPNSLTLSPTYISLSLFHTHLQNQYYTTVNVFSFWQLEAWKWNWRNSTHTSLFVCMYKPTLHVWWLWLWYLSFYDCSLILFVCVGGCGCICFHLMCVTACFSVIN